MHQVEHTHHSISASNGKHVALVREITREDGATKLLDLSHGLESVYTVENLDFVAPRATSNHVLTRSLHELGAVDLARGGGLEVTVVPGDVVEQLAIIEREHGKLVTSLIRSGKDDSILHVQGVGSHVGSEDTSDGRRLSHIPHFDGLVPTSSHDQVLVHPLHTVDFHLVSSSASATALVQNFELAGLLVVHTNQTVRITGCEVGSVVVVVTADGLDIEAVDLFLDLVQQATRGGVPVLNDSVTVGG